MDGKEFAKLMQEQLNRPVNENDETPFPQIENGKVQVLGNPNATKVKKNNYELTFRVPKSIFAEKAADDWEEVGECWIFKKNYDDKFLSTRKDALISECLLDLLPFVEKINEDGTVEEMDAMTQFRIFNSFGDKMIIPLRKLISIFLDEEPELMEFALIGSTLQAFGDFNYNHPEAMDAAKRFLE